MDKFQMLKMWPAYLKNKATAYKLPLVDWIVCLVIQIRLKMTSFSTNHTDRVEKENKKRLIKKPMRVFINKLYKVYNEQKIFFKCSRVGAKNIENHRKQTNAQRRSNHCWTKKTRFCCGKSHKKTDIQSQSSIWKIFVTHTHAKTLYHVCRFQKSLWQSLTQGIASNNEQIYE